MRRKPTEREPVTVESLEECIVFLAALIIRYNVPEYLPLLHSLERDQAAMQSRGAQLDEARLILERHRARYPELSAAKPRLLPSR